MQATQVQEQKVDYAFDSNIKTEGVSFAVLQVDSSQVVQPVHFFQDPTLFSSSTTPIALRMLDSEFSASVPSILAS